MDDRAIANALFYFGPVWKEHKTTMTGLLRDSDNVLLLRPLTPDRGVAVLSMVDPVTEPDGAQGEVVAQIFALKAVGVDSFVRQADLRPAELLACAKPASSLLWMCRTTFHSSVFGPMDPFWSR
jgi:hypothetical protein